MIAVPDLSSTVRVASALKELVESAQIRILDLVGCGHQSGRAVSAVEPELVSGLAELHQVEGEVGGLLSEEDIALAGSALLPGTSALIVVVEDRWARLLADAARDSGGRIIGGERIPRHRLEQSGRARPPGTGEWRWFVKRISASRRRHVDLLRRRPLLDPVTVDAPAPRAGRRVDQLRALVHLVERGVLSAEEFERHQEKVFRQSPQT